MFQRLATARLLLEYCAQVTKKLEPSRSFKGEFRTWTHWLANIPCCHSCLWTELPVTKRIGGASPAIYNAQKCTYVHFEQATKQYGLRYFREEIGDA
eukprot:6198562-Pleurochrysis_carterae.AAC.2